LLAVGLFSSSLTPRSDIAGDLSPDRLNSKSVFKLHKRPTDRRDHTHTEPYERRRERGRSELVVEGLLCPVEKRNLVVGRISTLSPLSVRAEPFEASSSGALPLDLPAPHSPSLLAGAQWLDYAPVGPRPTPNVPLPSAAAPPAPPAPPAWTPTMASSASLSTSTISSATARAPPPSISSTDYASSNSASGASSMRTANLSISAHTTTSISALSTQGTAVPEQVAGTNLLAFSCPAQPLQPDEPPPPGASSAPSPALPLPAPHSPSVSSRSGTSTVASTTAAVVGGSDPMAWVSALQGVLAQFLASLPTIAAATAAATPAGQAPGAKQTTITPRVQPPLSQDVQSAAASLGEASTAQPAATLLPQGGLTTTGAGDPIPRASGPGTAAAVPAVPAVPIAAPSDPLAGADMRRLRGLPSRARSALLRSLADLDEPPTPGDEPVRSLSPHAAPHTTRAGDNGVAVAGNVRGAGGAGGDDEATALAEVGAVLRSVLTPQQQRALRSHLLMTSLQHQQTLPPPGPAIGSTSITAPEAGSPALAQHSPPATQVTVSLRALAAQSQQPQAAAEQEKRAATSPAALQGSAAGEGDELSQLQAQVGCAARGVQWEGGLQEL